MAANELFRLGLVEESAKIVRSKGKVSVVYYRESRAALISCNFGGRGKSGMMLVFRDQK